MITVKPLVYIAGPFRSDPLAGTRVAVNAGLNLWRTGNFAVIIPHLTLLVDLMDPMPDEKWLEFDRDQLVHCDAVLRLPGASAGVDGEVALAATVGIPVFGTFPALFAWAEER